jgi:hypothetical protein
MDVPPPPGEFKFTDPMITDDMTQREKLTIHAVNPSCASCHKLFDGIGFAMENYDPVGHYRTMDRTKAIDPTGTLPLAKGELHFANFVDLVDQISKLPDPYDCFATQYLKYSTGRETAQVSTCEREPLARAFADSGYKVDALVLAVINSPGFAARKN